ncbi:phytanoyl-CoA dioxygenase family protein [Paenibacillus sp. GCM10023252]|uniref:phytanoyl-CoA dioxygenase family protein n=1 Tax=Paenibacillus sp. GCM10023252 TaxID=3252649 RepID=UPI003623AD07
MNTSTLNTQEVMNYKKDGYVLHHKQVFTPQKLRLLETIFEEHLAEKGSKLSDELDKPHLRDPRLLEFLLCDEVLDLVEPLIGPNIGLWSSHFICKEPYTGRATPWHEDSAYWNGKLASYDHIVTLWLAIDPSNQENGCMRVIPGTHHNGFSEYISVDSSRNTFDSEIKNVDESAAVYFELDKGECSLHDSRIIHGAAPNTSPYRRCGYTMRYFAADIKVLDGRQLWLARGKDLAGNSYENV